MDRSRRLAPLIAVCLIASVQAEPLSTRIDRLIDAESLAPAAREVDDATFARRVYLDLTGVIPTAGQVRAFAENDSTGKREALVDQLLSSPNFAEHMADVFDVMLMERRANKYIKQTQWRDYLVNHFRSGRPLNHLAREVLAADGGNSGNRAAARFYLDREADADEVTRAIGRVFLGRDLQCAQCHDHPEIDEYVQTDYYGLQAFLARSYLFTDSKKTVYYAEKAEGETTYRSVFKPKTGPYPAAPKLVGRPPVQEKPIAPADAYKVKPAKGVRPIPSYSRRQRLADELTDPSNNAFNRNMANRLWAHMFGRGLVHPVDHHHGGNPPAHPKVLDALTAALVESNYDVKAMLRAIALTQAYQATSAPQRDTAEQGNDVAARIESLSDRLKPLRETVNREHERVDDLEDEVDASAKSYAAAAAALATVQKTYDAAKKSADAANKSLAKPNADYQAALKTTPKLTAASQAAAAAANALPADKDLAAAAKTIAERATKAEAALAALKKKVDPLAASAKKANDALAKARTALDAAKQKRNAARNSSIDAQRQRTDAIAGRSAHLAAVARTQARIDFFKQAVSNDAPDAFIQAMSNRFIVREPKPLSPEQLARSMMRATGYLAPQRAAAEAEVLKQEQAAAAKAKKDGKTPPTVSEADRAAAVERVLQTKTASAVGAFVKLFAAAPGQPQDEFFATVDQTLFLNNNAMLRGWLAPSGNSLTARLVKAPDAQTLADDLYLNVLSRGPTDGEIKAVEAYLSRLGEDRATAVREMAWALLTSVEFRFNH